MSEIDLSHWMFLSTLQTVADGFWHALAAVEDRMTEAYRAMTAHDEYLEEGGDDEEVWEDAVRLHGKSDELAYRHFDAGQAVGAIREAFVITLFHLWERAARGWTGCHDQGFEALAKAVRGSGIPLDPGIYRLNDLANFLKHDNKEKEAYYRRALRAYILGPYLRVTLTSDAISDLIAIVERSCPPPPPARREQP